MVLDASVRSSWLTQLLRCVGRGRNISSWWHLVIWDAMVILSTWLVRSDIFWHDIGQWHDRNLGWAMNLLRALDDLNRNLACKFNWYWPITVGRANDCCSGHDWNLVHAMAVLLWRIFHRSYVSRLRWGVSISLRSSIVESDFFRIRTMTSRRVVVMWIMRMVLIMISSWVSLSWTMGFL
jgi:uncharacterized membrane protein (UPF0136 family)